jgi:hypothetical protein
MYHIPENRHPDILCRETSDLTPLKKFLVIKKLGILKSNLHCKKKLNYTCFQTIYVVKPSIKDTR